MNRWWRALLTLVGLALAVACALWLARPWLQAAVGAWLESELTRASGLPVVVDDFELSLAPPAVAFSRLRAGDPALPALETGAVEARLDPFAWAAVVTVARLSADVAALPETAAGSAALPSLPAALPSIAIEIGAVDVASDPWRLSSGRTEVGLRRRLPGPALASVRSEALGLERDGERLSIDDLAFAVELRGRGIVLRSAHIAGDGIAVEATERDADAVHAEVSLDLAPVARIAGWAARLGGDLRFQGDIAFGAAGAEGLEDLDIRGALAVDDPEFDELRARRATASVQFRQGLLSAADLDVIIDEGRITGGAEIALAEPHPLRAEIRLDAPDAVAFFPDLAPSFSAGALAATADLRGAAVPPCVEGRIEATVSSIHRREAAGSGGPRARTAATVSAPSGMLDARIDLDLARVGDATEASGAIRLLPAGAAAASAAGIELRLRLADDSSISGQVEWEVDKAVRLRPLVPELTGGSMSGRFSVGGGWDAPRLEGELSAESLDVAGYRFDRIAGGFELDSEALLAKALEMHAVGGVASLNGRIAFTAEGENDWRATLAHVDLAATWVALNAVGVSLPYLTGTLDGEAVATGSWAAGDFDAAWKTGAVSVGTERVTAMSVQVASRARQWTVDGELARRPSETVRLVGAGDGLGPMWLSAWSTPWRVSGFRFLRDLPPRRGDAVLSVNLYGRLDAPLGSAELTLIDLGFGERTVGTVSGEIHALPGGILQMFLSDAEERLSVEGTLTSESGRPFRIRSTLREFDLAHLLAPAQALAMTAHGTGEFSGRAADLRRSLSGELRLTQFSLGREDLRLSAATPVVVRARDGRLVVESFDLRGEHGRLEVGGTVALTGAVALDLRVDADAGVVETIPKSPVRWATGRARLDARVLRPEGGDFDLDGHGSLEGVSVDLGLPFLLTEATGGFTLDGSRILLERLTGRAGGGEFALEGHVDLEEGLALRWEAREVSSGFLDWLEDQVSGTGEIRGPFDEITVAGDVRVLSAVYDRDLEITDILPVFRRAFGPASPDPDGRPVFLDLRIVAPDSIYVDNNLVEAEFSADLHLGGTDIDPVLRGRVDLLDGQATVFDRRFEVTVGRIRFAGGTEINPALEFVANADVSTAEGEYNIVAKVGGTLNDPRVELGADDASLTTNDVVTLLTVGKTMAQLQSEGGGVSAADLAQLAPMFYGSQVERGVKRYLPVDRFSLEPGFSRVTGDFEPRVTVGTEIARGLRGTLATTLAAQTQNRVQLEYQLTPRMLVVGSWESRTETTEGGFGGALKFRFRFRYLPLSLLPAGCCETE